MISPARDRCCSPFVRTLIFSLTLIGTFGVAAGSNAEAQINSPDTVRLSLEEARSLAIKNNRDLRAARLDINIARGNLKQAGVLLRSNPEVDVLRGSPGTEFGVSQELEVAGQRGSRQRAASAALTRASFSVSNVARTTLGDVDRAFYRYVAADRRSRLAEEVRLLNQRLSEAAQRQLQAGEISELEFNLAIVEGGRSQGRALAATRERQEALSNLRLLLGLGGGMTIVAVTDAPIPITDSISNKSVPPMRGLASDAGSALVVRGNSDSLVAAAFQRRPDLLAGDAAIREAAAELSVARRERFPNLLLRASSERIEGSDERQIRPGLGFSIPAFNRNQGEISARGAAVRQAELSKEALNARVSEEVSRSLASYETAATETRVLEQTVLTPARENRRLLEIAYKEGKVGLAVLLLIRNQAIDAELEYWDAWLAQHIALAELDEATGETVASFTPNAVPPSRR